MKIPITIIILLPSSIGTQQRPKQINFYFLGKITKKKKMYSLEIVF